MRIHARVDNNHPLIVRALREVGASVQSLASLGDGCPDLLVGFRGRNYLFEIKDPVLKPSAKQLTEDEKAWHIRWQGQVNKIESVIEALRIIGLVQVKS